MARTIEIIRGENYKFDKYDYDVKIREATNDEIILLSDRGYINIPSNDENSSLIIFKNHEMAIKEFNAQQNFLTSHEKYKLTRNQVVYTISQLEEQFNNDFSQSYHLFKDGIYFHAEIINKHQMIILREHEIDEEEKERYEDFGIFSMLFDMTDEEREDYFKLLKETKEEETDYEKMISDLRNNFRDKYKKYLFHYVLPFKFEKSTNNIISGDFIYLFPQNNSKIGLIDTCKIIETNELCDGIDENIFITYESVLAVHGEILKKFICK